MNLTGQRSEKMKGLDVTDTQQNDGQDELIRIDIHTPSMYRYQAHSSSHREAVDQHHDPGDATADRAPAFRQLLWSRKDMSHKTMTVPYVGFSECDMSVRRASKLRRTAACLEIEALGNNGSED